MTISKVAPRYPFSHCEAFTKVETLWTRIANLATCLCQRILKGIRAFASIPSLIEKKFQQILGSFIGQLVIFGTVQFPKELMRELHEAVVGSFTPNQKEVTLKTKDNVVLNGIEIIQDTNAHELQKWVIYFTPNNGPWEYLYDRKLLPRPEEANFLCYNYRGVSYSEGSPDNEDILFSDAYEIVDSLLAKGVRPENIVLQGWSLGAMFASFSATRLKAEQKEVAGLFVDRAFTSLTELIDKTFGLYGVIGKIATWSRWKLDMKPQAHLLPQNSYCLFSPSDEMIATVVSFCKLLKEQNIGECHQMETLSSEEHGRPWTMQEQHAYQMWLRKTFQLKLATST